MADLDFDELYPGRFLKAGEFKGRVVTLTVTDVDIEDLGVGKQAKVKGYITFAETKKQLCLNKTNGLCIKAMFGRRTGGWIGHKLMLFPSPYEGDIAIRVWGSPELAADQVIDINLPNKKPFKMTMHKAPPARKGANDKAAPAPTPPPAPAPAAKPDQAKTQRNDGQDDAPFQAEGEEADPFAEMGDPGQATPEEKAEWEREQAAEGR